MPAQTETYTQQVIRSLLARAAPGVVGLADGASGGSGFVVQQDRVGDIDVLPACILKLQAKIDIVERNGEVFFIKSADRFKLSFLDE